PSKGAIVKKARNRVIKEEFDGGNFRELSCKFGISDIQVRKIVK
ncbi:MAG: DNA-binding protein, partial [Peptostreptococcaceae bacterium]|nr:DNA-binding protein [Peptostreptococcaceae bacterium]